MPVNPEQQPTYENRSGSAMQRAVDLRRRLYGDSYQNPVKLDPYAHSEEKSSGDLTHGYDEIFELENPQRNESPKDVDPRSRFREQHTEYYGISAENLMSRRFFLAGGLGLAGVVGAKILFDRFTQPHVQYLSQQQELISHEAPTKTSPNPEYQRMIEKYGPPGKFVWWLNKFSHEQFPDIVDSQGRQSPGSDYRYAGSQCFPNALSSTLNDIFGYEKYKVEQMEHILMDNALGWDLPNGLEDPSAQHVAQIAKFFGVKSDWLSDLWSNHDEAKFNKLIRHVLLSGHMVLVGLEGTHWEPLWAIMDANGKIAINGDRVAALDSRLYDITWAPNRKTGLLTIQQFVQLWDGTAVVIYKK